MTKQPSTCTGCSLHTIGEGFVQLTLPKNYDKIRLLVQGEAPGSDEVDAGKPFVGKAGHWIRHNILYNAGIKEDEVLFDNTLRCLPPKNKKGEWYPIGDAKNVAEHHCRQYDVWSHVPTSVPMLLVGGKALEQRLGHDKISEWHGHIQLDESGRLVGCTYHPSAVMRNPNLLPVAIRESANVLVASRNPAVLERPLVKKQFTPYREGQQVVVDLEYDKDAVHMVGVAYDGKTAYSSFGVAEGLEVVRQHIQNGTRIIGHNLLTADLPLIGAVPLSLGPAHVVDTQILAHLVHAHLAELGLFGLGDMVRFYEPTSNWKNMRLEHQSASEYLEYNGYDCAYNYRLFDHLSDDMTITDQWHLVEKQQTLAQMSYEMRKIGVPLDVPALTEFAVNRTKAKVAEKASFTFNPNSPKQIKDWLKDTYKISVPDTEFDTLAKLRGIDAELDRFIDYRVDTKSLTTWFPIEYEDKKKTIISSIANCAYPRFNPTGTAVARFSCADPNFQNMPPNLRRFLIPPDPDMEIVAFDGAQIENRTVAWISGETNMLKAFESGMDFHRANAANIYGKLASEISKEERQFGKTVTHATNYKETYFNLARRLYGNSTREALSKAKALQDAFFAAYPNIRRWHREMEEQFRRGDVMVRNPFGRVRFVYERTPHEFAKRACHFLGCSTAADIINQAGINVRRELKLLPFLIVHDELAYFLPKGEAGVRLRKDIKEVSELPIKEMGGFVVPVTLKRGPNYGELVEEK